MGKYFLGLNRLSIIISLFLSLPVLGAGERIDTVLSSSQRQRAFSSPLLSSNFQTALDEISNSVRVRGNEQVLMLNGQQSYPVRYRLIQQAKKSIIMSTFSIYSGNDNGEIADPFSRKMVELLIEKKQQGVEVLVIYDGGTSVLAKSQTAIDQLRAHHIKVIKYNPIVTDQTDVHLLLSIIPGALKFAFNQHPINNRWHEKTMIVDGEYLISGGLNWGAPYALGNAFSKQIPNYYQSFYSHPLIQELRLRDHDSWHRTSDTGWRDTDVLIKGPLATQAARRLLIDFSLIEYLQNHRGADFEDATIDDVAQSYNLYMQRYQSKEDDYFNTTYLQNERRDMVKPGESSLGSARYVFQRPYLDHKLKSRHTQLSTFARQNRLNYNTDNPSTYITNLYLNLIDKAETQILWGCHSNRPPEPILKALERAARRGVKVFIIGNSREAAKTLPDGGTLMYPMALCHYRDLLEAGGPERNIRIFEWQRSLNINGTSLKSGAFHSKVFSVDGVITSVGSFNMSKASFGKHTEGTVVINDPDFAHSAEKMFSDDLLFTNEVNIEDLPIRKSSSCSNY